MVILGLDPGIAATGYGVVRHEHGGFHALGHGVLRTSASEAPADRLAQIHAGVGALLAEHRPEWAAVEELFVGSNPRNILGVGQARGAALAACGAAGVAVAEYPVATIKSAVCGYGRAEKQQVSRMVRAIVKLGDQPASDHATDALAAAVCHAQHGRLAAAARS